MFNTTCCLVAGLGFGLELVLRVSDYAHVFHTYFLLSLYRTLFFRRFF